MYPPHLLANFHEGLAEQVKAPFGLVLHRVCSMESDAAITTMAPDWIAFPRYIIEESALQFHYAMRFGDKPAEVRLFKATTRCPFSNILLKVEP